jgi:hypothetical protein
MSRIQGGEPREQMTTRAHCFRCLVAALVLCYATACDPRLLRSIVSGCSPPQDVPYANTAKTKRLDRDLFVLFNGRRPRITRAGVLLNVGKSEPHPYRA